MTTVSAVIPTAGERDTLGEVVAALCAGGGLREVIIVWDREEIPTRLPGLPSAAHRGSDAVRSSAAASVEAPVIRSLCTGGGRGPGAARNVGAAAAVGEVIVFVDDDVIPASGAVAALARACAAGGTAAVGRVLRHPEIPETIYTAFAYAGAVHLASSTRVGLAPVEFCSALAAVPRSALQEAGGFDETLRIYYEDTELAWRLAGRGLVLRWCPAATGLHRREMDRAWFLARCRNLGRQLRLLRARKPAFAKTLRVIPRRLAWCSPVLAAAWPLLRRCLPPAEILPPSLGLPLLKVVYAAGVLSFLNESPVCATSH